MSKLVDRIRQSQRALSAEAPVAPLVPEHTGDSKALVWGCVDARVKPDTWTKQDGSKLFPTHYGEIVRNIAARAVGPDKPDGKEEAELLETAIKKEGIKRIILVGHTHCGGVAACMHGGVGPHLTKHLATLGHVREEAINAGGSDLEKLRRLEMESVRDSARNLMAHKVVRDAVAAGELTIEPYLLHTATKELIDLREANPQFHVEKEPPEHQPRMVIFCGPDADLLPQDALHLDDGEALIFRSLDGDIKGVSPDRAKEAAMVEFAILRGVDDIVVLEKTDNKDTPEMLAAKTDKIRRSLDTLKKSYSEIPAGMARHGWIVNTDTQVIQEMDLVTGKFRPMGDMAQARNAMMR